MSINAKYRRITPEELADFQRDPKSISSFFGLAQFDQMEEMDIADDEEFDEEAFLGAPAPVDDPGRLLDINNEWQAIHFLLTGEATFPEKCQTPPPLGNIVMGGSLISDVDVGYGPPRFLTPAEVHDAAQALQEIDAAELGRRFDVEAYNAAGGYPRMSPTGWSQKDVEPLLETYSALVAFYQEAAQVGDALLLWVD